MTQPHDRHPEPSDQPAPGARKRYEKPTLTSHKVFEVSLACVKVTGSAMCQAAGPARGKS